MSDTASDFGHPPANEGIVRGRAVELRALAERFGITELRFASPRRLVGRVSPDMDLLDVVLFDDAASDLLGATVQLFSDSVLTKPNVSPALVGAQPV